ncbi:MAG TPA: Si-specific NAD(P)(+) transhydrogenase [Thermoanaerobaculia bacterium]|nr:Si-specific NAD(P)(+) transhydrogenase [Thermoanaerobaculia bacterium]
MEKYELFVLGTGPAGQRAAVQAAKLGKTVGICEKREVVGGVCINTGTIPSKTFREAVFFLSGFAQRGMYGPAYSVKENITAEDLLFRCHSVIRREIDVVRAQMKRNGVTLLGGAAKFTSPHTLTVTGLSSAIEIEAERIVIATGTRPATPPGVAVDEETILDSDGILTLKTLPRTMIIVGGGVIGVEYASMFAALGIAVTLIDKRPRLLDFVDGEIAEALSYAMRNMGCTLRLGEDVPDVHIEGPRRAVALLKSGKRIVADLLLYSIGRIGATADLDLSAAGLQADDRGRLPVNADYQTLQPHIYAVGDVIGFPALASTSLEQGRLAACHAFGMACTSMPSLYPIGIYSIPEISMVGKTEEQLTTSGVPYEVGVAHYREIARGAILGDDTGILKIIVHRETRQLLGVHILGTAATELVHIGQAFLTLGGTLDVLVETVFNYPTFAECYKVAALDAYDRLGPPAPRRSS